MIRTLLASVSVFLCTASQAQQVHKFDFKTPNLVLSDVNFTLEITAQDSTGAPVASFNDSVALAGVQRNVFGTLLPAVARFSGGKAAIEDAVMPESGSAEISVSLGAMTSAKTVRVIPGILSILPPLLAIILALVLRQVVISLFAGIWLGAVFIFDYNIVGGIFRVLDHFIVNAVTETSHTQIIIFSMMFGGMVGIISSNGGTLGIANLITRYAKTSRGGQLSTLFMAFVMFFDDYANVLVRGNLMRPITDKLRISREKLSFIVDAGAATVASVFIISTWIGYEVGLIEQGLKSVNSTEDAYSVFLQTIPYRFYPILTLIFVFLVGWMKRDFGPMLTAERRARSTGEVLREGSQPATDLTESTGSFSSDKPPLWHNGLLPILSILAVGLYGLYSTGTAALEAEGVTSYGVGEIISKSDSYGALMWASLSGCLVAVLLSVGQRILTLVKAIDAWFNGLKAMLLAMLILILAWAIGSVTQELHTAEYLVQLLRGTIAPHWLPVLVFLIAAGVSFATGTSWGTMAIMMPLVIPLGHTLSVDAQLTGSAYEVILHGVISSVLAGAVFGDHCSPISDTTILSSMASACDHIDHVRTQLPYALLVAAIGMLVGDIPTAFGLSPWISIAVGTATMAAALYFFGKKVE
ncbi:MAG: Na+/H+ antiporter NhaC family protein [Ignavibacteriae bacterium]|nr:Na+/H+ antiporter NhaC family protein [Ignavibacteriota bacterium]MCI0707943.1 Na+/H+ antiporter NhaC family protein [Ignavibacteriota bacterium]